MTHLKTSFGIVRIDWLDPEKWRLSADVKTVEDGVEELTFSLDSETPETPPSLSVEWSIPQNGVCARWYAFCDRDPKLPPNWGSSLTSQLAFGAPVLALYDTAGNNCHAFACSDALREVFFGAGVNECTAEIDCFVRLFQTPEAPRTHYDAKIRFISQNIFFSDAVRALFDWFADMPEYTVFPASENAFEPLYSSWYSYHKDDLRDSVIEAQAHLAAPFGMKTLIVDDGWQSDHFGGCGPYSLCGDWQAAPSKFPDMKRHAAAVRGAGLAFLLWYSVPFVGLESAAHARFAGKYLYQRLGAEVLDPRFPEVRDFLVSTYETAVCDWKLDGFKLDFIDSFRIDGRKDPAIDDDFAGRDCKTVPEGVDKLMTAVMEKLRARNKNILIEFRQNYSGPAIRKYGNIIRAADCPGDLLSNRKRTLDLRITVSEKTAVHADMLMWDMRNTPEAAARQLFAVFFAVPQISVRLEDLPSPHAEMLRFWLHFWIERRELLLRGHLKAFHPELNYPLVLTERTDDALFVLYEDTAFLPVPAGKKTVWIVNATQKESVMLDLPDAVDTESFDVFGKPASDVRRLPAGPVRLAVPVSGFAVLHG